MKKVSRQKPSTTEIIYHLQSLIPYETWWCELCEWVDDARHYKKCCICTAPICLDCAGTHEMVSCCDLEVVARDNARRATLLTLAAFRPLYGKDVATMIVWDTRADDIWWTMSIQSTLIHSS